MPFGLYRKYFQLHWRRKCNRPLQEGPDVDALIKSKEDMFKLVRALKEYGLMVSKPE